MFCAPHGSYRIYIHVLSIQPAAWWQWLADYSWHVHNLYPVQRKAATGVTPIEDISSGNVTRANVERRIGYTTPPGTLCMVAEPGKHGGAFDASNCRLGLVKRMDDDVAVFINSTGRQHERRSKNFWAYDLRPGLSPWTHLRMSHDADLTPPSGARSLGMGVIARMIARSLARSAKCVRA